MIIDFRVRVEEVEIYIDLGLLGVNVRNISGLKSALGELTTSESESWSSSVFCFRFPIIQIEEKEEKGCGAVSMRPRVTRILQP